MEGAKGFAAPSDEEPCVVALDVDDGGLVGLCGEYGGGGVDVEGVEDTGDDVESGAGVAVVAFDEADLDSGGFGADAENACATRVKDVDLDFVAADAEFEGCELDRLLHGLGRSDDAPVLRVFHRLAPCPAGQG